MARLALIFVPVPLAASPRGETPPARHHDADLPIAALADEDDGWT